jgi:serine/threonine-protein kinase HipA
MRQAQVLYKNEAAGLLIQLDNGSFSFKYNETWLANNSKPAISLTIPKRKKAYTAPFLFPFFFNMLPEGNNKENICQSLRIDEDDYFGLLLNTAMVDTIGAVTIVKIEEE